MESADHRFGVSPSVLYAASLIHLTSVRWSISLPDLRGNLMCNIFRDESQNYELGFWPELCAACGDQTQLDVKEESLHICSSHVNYRRRFRDHSAEAFACNHHELIKHFDHC